MQNMPLQIKRQEEEEKMKKRDMRRAYMRVVDAGNTYRREDKRAVCVFRAKIRANRIASPHLVFSSLLCMRSYAMPSFFLKVDAFFPHTHNSHPRFLCFLVRETKLEFFSQDLSLFGDADAFVVVVALAVVHS